MTEMLKQIPYWEYLTEDEKRRAMESAYVRHYVTGEQMYGPFVECVGMIHVLKGETRAYLLSDEGREVTLFRVVQGDNCIISASCVLAQISFEAHMEASEDSDILIIPVELFGEFCEKNVYVRCFAYELATTRFSSVVAVMEQTLFSRLDKRLAGCLLRLYKKTGDTEIRLTQEQLAGQVNSVRETVGRMLKRFAAEGMIEIHRGGVMLKNLKKLEDTAR